ncbi:glycogen/starch/alpha-glucan phosphorylase [Eubacterium sp. AB3007]|uniref:glycogen/starch/alpha-glucan phosphorylase n=1 Tax=Eubacterium sp. AB3007 TaxID=1392487 RepID=UPI00068AB9C6|nr:glycogen/starch/alpha-glucan phosphorylase [Eubacterium sp. AB3007]
MKKQKIGDLTANEIRDVDRKELKVKLESYLANVMHTTFERATAEELYKGLATVVNGQLADQRMEFNRKRIHNHRRKDTSKKIYYICMEFLLGQSLKNHLYNLGETEMVEEILQERDMTLEQIYDCEPDAGLGNGGLGRLAACFMDALTADGYDATGYSLCYEYGLFKQMIADGWQMEVPDNWLPGGRVWLNAREDDSFKVKFYGDYHEYWEDGRMKYNLEHVQEVEAIPYDMFISGADSKAVNKLRLWLAKDWDGFDMASFNSGDFTKAAQRTNSAEMITKVLYPADNIEEGKELRLKQQYLMVSASCQNIVRDQYAIYGTLDNFEKNTVIHINDTHPALCVPELMRIFMDDYGYSWDDAWKKVVGTISYTNHTVLAEALEKWNEGLVQSMLPRIYSIIQEIDRRFKEEMNTRVFPGDWGKINYMAPLGEQKVHMANLAVIGSHHINGVSALHSDILKEDLFHDFYLWVPERFTNVTNGIAYRRWLCQSNPALASLLDETIGSSYRHKYEKLRDFAEFKDDASVQAEVEKIKRENKVRLGKLIKERNGIDVDPDSLFVVQAKRMHEYKRQLLNALRIISRYQMLRNDPTIDMRPETYIFGAKAAPSYYLAKHFIQLIVKLGQEINNDPVISQKLKVVFLENYSVSVAEKLMPATEVSEQISLAGKEASGTGNMKMMINGAVTMGTLDGANVEIREAVGDENIFIFGQKAHEVEQNLREGYRARDYYEQNDLLRDAVDALEYGFAGESFSNIKSYLLDPSYSIADPYMCLKDFDDYCKVHQELQDAYEDRARWNSMSIVNIAEAARFAADRSIDDYAKWIWHTKPIV